MLPPTRFCSRAPFLWVNAFFRVSLVSPYSHIGNFILDWLKRRTLQIVSDQTPNQRPAMTMRMKGKQRQNRKKKKKESLLMATFCAMAFIAHACKSSRRRPCMQSCTYGRYEQSNALLHDEKTCPSIQSIPSTHLTSHTTSLVVALLCPALHAEGRCISKQQQTSTSAVVRMPPLRRAEDTASALLQVQVQIQITSLKQLE